MALFLPWSFCWGRPGPALLYLGALVILSPLASRAWATPHAISCGFACTVRQGGTLTIVVGLIAPRVL